MLSLVLFAVVMKVLRKDTPGKKQKMDYVGAAILTAGVTLVLVYITEGPSIGWLSLEALALLVPGLALTFYFFLFERNRPNPMIQLALLRIRNVLVANLVGLFSAIVMFLLFFAVVYYLELPLTYGLGLSVIASGLSMAPSTVGMIVTGPSVGKLMARYGPKPALLLGSGLQIAGLSLFILNRATRMDVAIDLTRVAGWHRGNNRPDCEHDSDLRSARKHRCWDGNEHFVEKPWWGDWSGRRYKRHVILHKTVCRDYCWSQHSFKSSFIFGIQHHLFDRNCIVLLDHRIEPGNEKLHFPKKSNSSL